jgi:hypothetical protein
MKTGGKRYAEYCGGPYVKVATFSAMMILRIAAGVRQ